MSNVVSLNKFRKKKSAIEKAKRADTNRRLHGRTKVERLREQMTKEQLQKRVEGALLVNTTKAGEEE